ncbi:hypothetical protein KA107_01790 [Candidatus Pacearchaeota archaeon]|nr:hypothetical protein [Candidatus Pacearchaeota archaeon]
MKDPSIIFSSLILIFAGIWSIRYGLKWYGNKISEKKARKITGSDSIYVNFKNLKKNYKRTGILNIVGGIILLLWGIYMILFY